MAQQLAKNVSFRNNTSWTSLLDMIYPKGSYYFSNSSTNPASLFGGGWTAVTGRFPYFNAGTGTGGSNTHTLTVAEMPSHSHDVKHLDGIDNGVLRVAHSNALSGTGWYVVASSGAESTTLQALATGGGQAHNNMPAYKEVYAWYRTS